MLGLSQEEEDHAGWMVSSMLLCSVLSMPKDCYEQDEMNHAVL